MSMDTFMAGLKKREKQSLTYCTTKDMNFAPVRLSAAIENICVFEKLKLLQ